MRRFISLFFIFLLLITGLAVSADYIISHGLRKTDIRKYQAWNDIYASNIKGDLIILGASKAWCEFSTQIMDSILELNSYNLGIDGLPINYQLIRYNTYRRFCPKPKIIVHDISFGTLQINTSGYEREQFFPFIFDDSLMAIVSKDKKITLFDRKLPLIRYFGYRQIIEDGFTSFFGKKHFIDGEVYKGYRGNDYKWNGEELKKIDSVTFSKNPVAMQMFDSYLARCKEEDIQVILVFSPIYIEATRKVQNKKGMHDMFRTFAQKYDFMLLDYTNDTICADTAFFYNATHLNKKGSELFSTKLANDLKLVIDVE